MVNKDNYVLNCTNYASRYTRAMAYPWLKKRRKRNRKRRDSHLFKSNDLKCTTGKISKTAEQRKKRENCEREKKCTTTT